MVDASISPERFRHLVRWRNTHSRIAIRTAREFDLPLSVRGGGHDWAGRSLRDSGLVVDLAQMRNVSVDASTRCAVVQGGALTGDVVHAARLHTLVPVSGTVKAVGSVG